MYVVVFEGGFGFYVACAVVGATVGSFLVCVVGAGVGIGVGCGGAGGEGGSAESGVCAV